MADATNLLAQITKAAQQNLLSEKDVINAYRKGMTKEDQLKFFQRMSFSTVLTYLGGCIVLTGIIILMWQNWGVLPSVTRILVTLGAGLVSYGVGAYLYTQREDFRQVALTFFVLATFLLPLGIGVALYEMDVDMSSEMVTIGIPFVLTATYVASLYIFRHTLFAGFSVLFGTWLFIAITNYFLARSLIRFDHITEYRIMTVGISYLLLGHSMRGTRYSTIDGFFNVLGLICVLGTALTLGGYKPEQNVFWELSYPLITFGFTFLGIQIREKTYVTLSSAAFMIYILKITSEYFQDKLGWPLALVFAGLLLIGTGYVTHAINSRLIGKNAK